MNEIDWDKVLAIAGAAIVGLFGGGSLTTWWWKVRDRKDKLEDRRLSRDEVFRSELRHAYAQFVAAQSKRLVLTSDLVALIRVLEDAETEVRSRQPTFRYPKKIVEEENPHFVAKARALRDALAEVQAESTLRLAELLLLDSDPARSTHLAAIFEAPLAWPDGDDRQVDAQIAAHEENLRALMKLLVGAFASERWDSLSSASHSR